MSVREPASQTDLIQSLICEISQEITDLPIERKERINAALHKVQSCVDSFIPQDNPGNYPPPIRKMKRLLAASDAKYRDLAESITDPFVVYDTDLRIIYRNKASAEATHIPDELALGKTFSEVYPNLVGTEIHQLYVRALKTHQPQKQLNHWVRPTDGENFYYDLFVYPGSDGLIVFSKDVTARVQAEMSQQDALERAAWMARFPDENPYPVARVSVKGEILYCNRASADSSEWAFKVGEWLSTPFHALLEQASRQGKQVGGEVQVRDAIYAVQFVPFPNEHYINIYGMDITERKRAEAALEKAYNDLFNEQNRLLAVMEALPIGISIQDQNGGVIQKNKGYDAVWGSPIPPANSVDDYEAYQAWWVETGQRVHPEEWAAALAVQKGETITGQFLQIQRFDGTRAFVLNSGTPIRNVNGEITGSAVAIMDITKMIDAENALRQSQERLRVALSAAPIIVYTCDRELRYTWIYNPLRGFRAEGSLGKRDDELVSPEAVAELIATKQLALDTGQGKTQEVKVPLNGENTYYILTTDPIRDQYGNVTGLTCSAIDITEQKRIQAAQQEQAIQIEVQRRLMDQREQDRSVIARDLHDGPIQTLSSTLFHLQMIKDKFQDATLQAELEQIGVQVKNTIRELRVVMNDLRPPALITFGFSKVIRHYIEDFRIRFPDLEIALDAEADDKLLSDDAHLTLFRIFQAGINNIVRHSDASKAWVVFKIEQDRFVLELRDNGVGFEPKTDFSQLTRNGHFGLVGMKERAEAIGAEFSVSSERGKGTTLIVKGRLNGKNLKQ